jgi:exodeoxyribonuclease VII large subunit
VAIRELSRPNDKWKPLDLVVVTRGGGSIEDLWEFNEEIVARAIVDSPLPMVSAVGHEIDFTIADFVADLRAPTPSAAAELIVPDANDLQRRVAELSGCLDRHLRNFISQNQTRLRFLSERTLGRELMQRLRSAQQATDLVADFLSRHVRRAVVDRHAALTSALQKLQVHSPARELAARRERMRELQRRVAMLPTHGLEQARQRFRQMEGFLRVLGPEATLRRGYTITTTDDGAVVKSVTQVVKRNRITTRVSDGSITSEVTEDVTPDS